MPTLTTASMATGTAPHPGAVLLGARAGALSLPACDHYSGTEPRMRKSLELQADMASEFGTCVFDVTLDCEDGAAVGAEAEQAALVADLALAQQQRLVQVAGDRAGGPRPLRLRVAARVHALGHPAFAADVATIVGRAGTALSHVMLPKVESVADVEQAVAAIDAAWRGPAGQALPVHALIESPAALYRASDIASHPRVESLSFGLMDFVSAHGGAIPASAMTSAGQFDHPLVRRAKLEIAAASHAHGKVPSHCVVTEFRDVQLLREAAGRAAREFGYTRMWSIHPDQIRPILEAFAPGADEVAEAIEILQRASQADWAPTAHRGHLHDRASYRYHWLLLSRAWRTGCRLPPEIEHAWFAAAGGARPTTRPQADTSPHP